MSTTKQMPFFTQSGQKCDLGNLKPEHINIQDISGALSKLCRYNGQTLGFYSVAEHSVILCRYAQARGMRSELQKALLLHDASEAYVGDVVYHLKGELPFFKQIEEKILRTVFARFEVEYDHNMIELQPFDRAVCIDEMYQLMPYVDPALFSFGHQPLHIDVMCWAPERAQLEFMNEYNRLFGGQSV
jgi:hypothetical protein